MFISDKIQLLSLSTFFFFLFPYKMQSSSDRGMNYSLRRGSVIFVDLQRTERGSLEREAVRESVLSWENGIESRNCSRARVKTNATRLISTFPRLAYFSFCKKKKKRKQTNSRLSLLASYCNSCLFKLVLASGFEVFPLGVISFGRIFRYVMCFSHDFLWSLM